MDQKNLGALLVVNKANKLTGIFSERDYMKKVILKGFRSADIEVKDVMAKDLVVVSTNTSTRQCLQLMTTGRFRHLPIVDSTNRVRGIISIGDLVKDIIEQQDQTIQFQRSFIAGVYTFDPATRL